MSHGAMTCIVSTPSFSDQISLIICIHTVSWQPLRTAWQGLRCTLCSFCKALGRIAFAFFSDQSMLLGHASPRSAADFSGKSKGEQSTIWSHVLLLHWSTAGHHAWHCMASCSGPVTFSILSTLLQGDSLSDNHSAYLAPVITSDLLQLCTCINTCNT